MDPTAAAIFCFMSDSIGMKTAAGPLAGIAALALAGEAADSGGVAAGASVLSLFLLHPARPRMAIAAPVMSQGGASPLFVSMGVPFVPVAATPTAQPAFRIYKSRNQVRRQTLP
ncbi:hypothetical protein [Phenylobacterium sp. J367]|uniref:hypothetical protein n=1 Tax=Phenylobacterium sp. J367 TaxID=2898435 RepID=UPI002150DDBB|nr:hypothetical protein [Phenylobacterium sp. J367]MCR5880174.1 hypothetical protein [Phenylobacterium sp. J367]